MKSRQADSDQRGKDNGEKGERFTGTIIKNTWTITRGGWKQGRKVERAGVVKRGWGKGRKLYLNSNKKEKIWANKINDVKKKNKNVSTKQCFHQLLIKCESLPSI